LLSADLVLVVPEYSVLKRQQDELVMNINDGKSCTGVEWIRRLSFVIYVGP
jgi:hypothetical protein